MPDTFRQTRTCKRVQANRNTGDSRYITDAAVYPVVARSQVPIVGVNSQKKVLVATIGVKLSGSQRLGPQLDPF